MVAIGITSIVLAQDKPQATPTQQQMSADEMMKEAMMAAAPAEQHQRLAKLAGKWKVSGKFFMPGFGEMPFTGSTDNTMILGGRFLRIEGAAKASQPGFESESLTVQGFDKRTGKYTMWSVDTMGTYSVSAEGDYDDAAKTLTLEGVNEEPGKGKVPFKFVLRFIDDAHYGLDLHMDFPGMGWHKIMEATHEKV
jgi:hypothetical protein